MDSGGIDPTLVSTGLLVRYFIDEAASGDEPEALIDRVEIPLLLPIEYDDGAVQYVENEGNRGLDWATAGGPGVPAIDVAGTKLEALEGRTEATLEVVVHVRAADQGGSRLIHFGADVDSDFSLVTETIDEVSFRFADATAARWPVDLSTAGRVVLTLVYEGDAQPEEQMRLYVDGQRIAPSMSTAPADPTIVLAPAAQVSLGNRGNGARSIDGTLYYAAVYGEALSDAEIQSNVAILLASDDRPRR